ncbi:MAG: hypothetical protein E7B02_11560 [Streptococcus salivarius]|nr:hypothetical protein [Streptococcus salivarius]
MDEQKEYEEFLEDEFSTSDYAEYYDEFYSELDEQEIERTHRIRSNLFSRSRIYVDELRQGITDKINSEIDLQKEYYQQSDNEVLYYQQINRNRIFYTKLVKAIVAGAVLIGILYLFLLIGR